jgi:hypothetical protein
MPKSTTKRRPDEAGRAFRKAWKLLGRLERRLEVARAEELKRIGQLGDGTGPKAVRRSAQLEGARAEIAQVEGLLSELCELIASNARAQSGQTVKDLVNDAAASIRDEAASAVPQAPVAKTRRTRKSISGPPAGSTSPTEGT